MMNSVQFSHVGLHKSADFLIRTERTGDVQCRIKTILISDNNYFNNQQFVD